MSKQFQFSKFMADPTDLRTWAICGLPSDDFSSDNGVLVTRGSRWPLMVDPQSQANKWIKKLQKQSLLVVDPKMDFMRAMEGAVQFGTPVLLQDVGEELDAALDPILLKKFMIEGNRKYVRLGDKLVEFNEDFKLFITTRMSNPHYSPEICTKTLIVNFAVKQKGLEDQLLGIVVQSEEPKLEEDKNKLVLQVALNKKTLLDLETKILNLLSSAKGSLLDDTALIDTLQQSKSTSENVKEALLISEETEKNIDSARENYRSCAIRSSILYFVLMDLAAVDSMYQFSLESYINLFKLSIKLSRKNIEDEDDLEERIFILNDYHTKAVYDNTCRGLFEKHKLLFSFCMCIRKLQSENKINMNQYNFFLRGGSIIDRSILPSNVNEEWLDETIWDNICDLSQFDVFKDIVDSINQNGRTWKLWYQDETPETARLPGDWENKLDEFQRMIVLRCLRPDRVVFACRTFISNNLGSDFIQPPSLDLNHVVQDSTPYTPIVFVLSAGSVMCILFFF